MRAYALPDGSRVRFHDLPGAGTPLVFLHGLGCASSFDYPTVAAAPGICGRRRLLVDLLGAGFSDAPAERGYAVEDHAHALAVLLDGLGVGPVDVYGHSMGGSIAIALAALGGGRVARLVVSEPNLVPGGGVFSRAIAAQAEDHYVALGHAALIEASRADGNDLWAASLRVASPVAVHRGAASLVRGSSPSWLAQLGALAIPRTAVYGARSLPDPDAAHLMEIGVPIRVVPDAGHSLAWDNPAGLAQALAEALPVRDGAVER